MKLIGRLLALVAGIIIMAAAALYILLQTRWGAEEFSQWVSSHTDYRLSFSKMDHSWSAPGDLIFRDVSLSHVDRPGSLVAKAVHIGLSGRQLLDPLNVSALLLEQGDLSLGENSTPIPLQADSLRLRDMNITTRSNEWPLRIQRANAAIIPWHPDTRHPFGGKASAELVAESLVLNGLTTHNIALRSSLNSGNLTISILEADLARGSLTGSIRHRPDGAWIVDSLRLNNVRLQTEKSLDDLLRALKEGPPLTIHHLEITDARLQGPAWAITDGDLSLQDVTLEGGDWKGEEGAISASAREFIWQSLHLQEPTIKADLTPRGALLRQFSTGWEEGLIQADGEWLREGHRAVINNLELTGLEYTLPENWKALWMQPLPGWLAEVTIKKLSARRNLIIDIDPGWPFQLTGLDATADNLILARQGQWGVWGGKAALSAVNATFNRVDVNRPSLMLTATPEQILLSDLRAFTGRGSLEASASISQTPQRSLQLNLKGQHVPAEILHAWGWPLTGLQGDANLSLFATGSLAAGSPLRPTVDATLRISDGGGKQYIKRMSAGAIPAP